MEDAQRRTQKIQYRQITGVHLKTEIKDEDLGDQSQFSMQDEHIVNIEAQAESVLVDFDNGEGIAIPLGDVSYLDYDIEEEEVEVQQHNQQPQRNPTRRDTRGRGGQRTRR